MAEKGQSKDNSSDETFDFICTYCDANGKIAEAVRYCFQCKGYCCQTCTDLHATFLVMKDHKLFGAGQGNQSKLHEYPTGRCPLHKEEVLDKFCEEHNEVCCCKCIATVHTSCPKKSILYIPDMIDVLVKRGDCKQIQSRLRDIMVSFDNIGKFKDDKLEALKDMKKEEIKKIINFQKALESIIKKAGEASISEIEKVYEELEKGILEEKHDIEGTKETLKESYDKLVKVEGNRAEHFVSSKMVEKKILEAELQMPKYKNDGLLFTFTPDQSLMKYLNDLHGIGMIDGKINFRTDLYRIKDSKDINIKLIDDFYDCVSTGCCLTFENQLLVTDQMNDKLKLIDTHTMKIIENCELDSTPHGVCITNDHEAAVACDDMILFVSIHGNKLKPTRLIKTQHDCCGITARDDKLYVTDREPLLYIYTFSGELLKTISQDNDGNELFSDSRHVSFTKNGDKMYVSDRYKGIVCFDSEENYLSTNNDSDLDGVDGVCVDGKGGVFVVGCWSHNVVQFNENGKKIGVVIQEQDGLELPRSVCFDQELNRLFVTMEDSNVVKMFKLL